MHTSRAIALFAADDVGLAIAGFLGKLGDPPQYLVLDSADRKGLNREIIERSAIENLTHVITSDRLYQPECLALLKEAGLDLFILSWWPYIIKQQIIELPLEGCINFHPSYLPYNRGKHYNFWSLIEESPFGVTLHWVNKGVDTGDIAFQSPIEVTWEDTGETLYHKAKEEIIRLFIEKYPLIKGAAIPRIKQDLTKGTFHKAAELEPSSQIELDKLYTGRELINLLRARTFRPFPGAWFVDNGGRYEVRISIEKIGSVE